MNESNNGKVSRRIALGAVAGAVLTAGGAPAADVPGAAGTVERTYEGRSIRGRFEEALTKALDTLREDLGDPNNFPDAGALANWRLVDISGVTGGIADRHEIRVRIAATCSTNWPRTRKA